MCRCVCVCARKSLGKKIAIQQMQIIFNLQCNENVSIVNMLLSALILPFSMLPNSNPEMKYKCYMYHQKTFLFARSRCYTWEISIRTRKKLNRISFCVSFASLLQTLSSRSQCLVACFVRCIVMFTQSVQHQRRKPPSPAKSCE